MKPIAIIGAGSSGLAMAAHLALAGYPVNVWNRTKKNIYKLSETKTIHCSGAVSGEAKIELSTNDLGLALKDVDLILITTPADSHRYLAEKMAPYIKKNHKIVLNPGRTFGVFEFEHVLQMNGAVAHALIAESQTIIYTCRKTSEDSVIILTFKNPVWLASRTLNISEEIFCSLPEVLNERFMLVDSMFKTSLGNVGAILHSAPVLLNLGWVENKKTIFKYYYDGITPTIANYIEEIDNVRVNIGRAVGIKLEGISAWMKRSYDVEGDNLFQCIQRNSAYKTIDAPQTLQHRYLFEDIPCGLVPYEDLGMTMGVDVEIISHLVSFASSVLDYDFRKNGRTLSRVGLNRGNFDTIK